MNKVELLPKFVEYKNELYQIAIYPNYNGNLCIGYELSTKPSRNTKITDNKLLSYVIEPDKPKYNSESITSDPLGKFINNGISNYPDLDSAIDDILIKLKENNIKSVL